MKTLQTFILLALTVLLVIGCARYTDFGKLVRSDEVRNTVESATVLPDHTYYYTGPEAKPDAIMALKNGFTLANERNFWIRVDISAEQLQSWNRIIQNETRIKYPYYGSRIITPDGREAGIWYSRYDYTVIKTPGPQDIIIYPPDVPVKRTLPIDRHGNRRF